MKRLAAVVTLVLLAVPGIRPRVFAQDTNAPVTPSQAARWIERYAQGAEEAVVGEIGRVESIAPLVRLLERETRRFVDAQPAVVKFPRLAAAAFLLDVARARLERDWLDVRHFIELGCSILRDGGPPVPGEREWHLAALSLTLGAADTQVLFTTGPVPRFGSYGHLDHSRERFRGEPRFELAEVLAREMTRTDTEFPVDGPWRGDAELREMKVGGQMEISLRNGKRKAIDAYRPLLDNPAIAEEVHLRLGHLHFQLRQDAEALRHLDAAAATPEPALRYLALLLTGRLHQRAGDQMQAEASLREALEVIPHAQSGVQALASLLFTLGRSEEAYLLVDDMFGAPARSLDPWRLFGYGDFRLWSDRIARVRGSWR